MMNKKQALLTSAVLASVAFLSGVLAAQDTAFEKPKDLGSVQLNEEGDILLYRKRGKPYSKGCYLNLYPIDRDDRSERLLGIYLPDSPTSFLLTEERFREMNSRGLQGYPPEGFLFEVIGVHAFSDRERGEYSKDFPSDRMEVRTKSFTPLRSILPEDIDPEGEFLVGADGGLKRIDVPIVYLFHEDMQFAGTGAEVYLMFTSLTRQIIGCAFEKTVEMDHQTWRKCAGRWEKLNEMWRGFNRDSTASAGEGVHSPEGGIQDISPFHAEALMVIDHRPRWSVDGSNVPGQLCVRLYDIKRYTRSDRDGNLYLGSEPVAKVNESKHEFPLLYEYYATTALPDIDKRAQFVNELLRCWRMVLKDLYVSPWDNQRFLAFKRLIDPASTLAPEERKRMIAEVYGVLDTASSLGGKAQCGEVEMNILFPLPRPAEEAPPAGETVEPGEKDEEGGGG